MKASDKYLPKQDLVQKLVKSTIKIDELDIASTIHQEAVKDYLKMFPSKIAQLSTEYEFKFLKKVLSSKDGYKLFLNIPNEKHTPELAFIFLHERLKDDLATLATHKEEPKMLMRKSYDDKLVFTFMYKTLKGEEVTYVDSELQMPVSLISHIKISLKLIDALSFIKKLDIAVNLLGFNTIYSEIRTIVNKIYRITLHSITNNDSSSYYNLTNMYSDIETQLIARLNNAFEDYGISVSNISLIDIAIPNDAKQTLENDFFNARRTRLANEDRLDFERKSLELYEKKIAIQSKYSGYSEALTEAEKDNAFKRYAYKNDPKDNSVTITNQKQLENKQTISDEEIIKNTDVVTNMKPNHNLKLFAILIFGIVAILFAIFGTPVVKLIGSGISLGLMGIALIIIAIYDKKIDDIHDQKLEEALEDVNNEQ